MRTIEQTRRVLNFLIWIGIPMGTLTAIYFSVSRFLRPAQPFFSSSVDYSWAIFYLIVFLVIGLLFKILQGRLLLLGTILVVMAAILVSMIQLDLIHAFLTLTWILTLSTFLGNVSLNKLSLQDRISIGEKLLLSMALGLTGLSCATFILGILHLYYRWLILVMMISLTLLSAPTFFRDHTAPIKNAVTSFLQTWKSTDLRSWSFLISVTCACGFGAFLWSVAPSIRYDALAYHIAAPIRYIQNHGLIPLPEAANTYWSHYGEMLYTLGLLLSDQPIPGLLHFSMGSFNLVAAYFVGRRLTGPRTGFLAVLILTSLPMIGYESGTAYIDLFVSAFFITSILSGILWWIDRRSAWLFMVGIMAGMALGTKISAGLILMPFMALLVILIFIYQGLHLTALKNACLIIVPCIIVFLPWLLLDWYRTGNPVFPMLNSFFRSPLWQMQQDWYEYRGLNIQFIKDLLFLPWNLVANSSKYQHEAPVAILGALPFLSMPWFIVGGKQHLDKTVRSILILSLMVVLGTTFLFLFSPNARYLIPLYPLMSIIAGYNLDILVEQGIASRFRKLFLASGIILALFYLYSTRLALIVRVVDFNERFPIKLILGQENKEVFLSRSIGVYDAFQFLNRTGDGDHQVLSVGNEFRLYTQSQIYGLFFSHIARDLLFFPKDEAELAKSLTDAGFEFLLISDGEMRWSPAYQKYPLLNQEFLDNYTTLVYAKAVKGVYIYRLQSGRAPTDHPKNIIQNAGFEEMDRDGFPSAWQVFGTPKSNSTVRYVHAGSKSIQIFGPKRDGVYSGLFQDVSTLPDQVYTLSYWCRADGSSSLQMQIDWLDANKELINSTQLWKSIEVDWKEYRISDTAPRNAAWGRVYLSVTGNGIVWCDDLAMVPGGNGYTIGQFPVP